MLDPAAVPIAFPELDSPAFLAESGQKYVFRARKAGEEVVLKIFKAGQEQERIDREIQAVAQLSCDYVPAVLESGQRTIGGKTSPFLVEKFVAGESYRAVLQRTPVQTLREVLLLGEALLTRVRLPRLRRRLSSDPPPGASPSQGDSGEQRSVPASG